MQGRRGDLRPFFAVGGISACAHSLYGSERSIQTRQCKIFSLFVLPCVYRYDCKRTVLIQRRKRFAAAPYYFCFGADEFRKLSERVIFLSENYFLPVVVGDCRTPVSAVQIKRSAKSDKV